MRIETEHNWIQKTALTTENQSHDEILNQPINQPNNGKTHFFQSDFKDKAKIRMKQDNYKV